MCHREGSEENRIRFNKHIPLKSLTSSDTEYYDEGNFDEESGSSSLPLMTRTNSSDVHAALATVTESETQDLAALRAQIKMLETDKYQLACDAQASAAIHKYTKIYKLYKI